MATHVLMWVFLLSKFVIVFFLGYGPEGTGNPWGTPSPKVPAGKHTRHIIKFYDEGYLLL